MEEKEDKERKLIIIRSNKSQRGGIPYTIVNGLFLFFKRSWPVLFIAVLSLILLQLCLPMWGDIKITGKRNKSVHQSANIIHILPSAPRVRSPVDTSYLIYDESTFSKIVSNRINIALKDKIIILEEFIIDLSLRFMDSTHRIVYYDPETLRIQLEFDPNNRNTIKADLKSSMSEYDLLIWDESIFYSMATFNDPALSVAEESWYLDITNARPSWQYTIGNSSITIAIIDDGFDLSHPELSNKNLIKPYNIQTKSNHVFANSLLFHGTHVAGIALANHNNSFGTSGIAPGCSFMPIQISDNSKLFTVTDIIDGILYAIKNGASVINISLGKEFSPIIEKLPTSVQKHIAQTTSFDEFSFWQELYAYADNENVTIVLAAGNQNIYLGINPMARSPKIITVTAVDQNMSKADFSNFGGEATVSAPGVQIYNSVPGGKFDYMDGTSMAAPIVSATVALMKSVNPRLTNSQIVDILRKSSQPVQGSEVGPLIQIDKALMQIMTPL